MASIIMATVLCCCLNQLAQFCSYHMSPFTPQMKDDSTIQASHQIIVLTLLGFLNVQLDVSLLPFSMGSAFSSLSANKLSCLFMFKQLGSTGHNRRVSIVLCNHKDFKYSNAVQIYTACKKKKSNSLFEPLHFLFREIIF